MVDAGGGTVDISAYGRTHAGSDRDTVFEEIAPPQCQFPERAIAYSLLLTAGTQVISMVPSSSPSTPACFCEVRHSPFLLADHIFFADPNLGV